MQTRRPEMELVVSSHKSVAELGVIGFAGIMHGILDAERDGGSMGTGSPISYVRRRLTGGSIGTSVSRSSTRSPSAYARG